MHPRATRGLTLPLVSKTGCSQSPKRNLEPAPSDNSVRPILRRTATPAVGLRCRTPSQVDAGMCATVRAWAFAHLTAERTAGVAIEIGETPAMTDAADSTRFSGLVKEPDQRSLTMTAHDSGRTLVGHSALPTVDVGPNGRAAGATAESVLIRCHSASGDDAIVTFSPPQPGHGGRTVIRSDKTVYEAGESITVELLAEPGSTKLSVDRVVRGRVVHSEDLTVNDGRAIWITTPGDNEQGLNALVVYDLSSGAPVCRQQLAYVRWPLRTEVHESP
jgi:hypothetical protein